MNDPVQRAAHARQARVQSGQARKLLAPDQRVKLLYYWLHHFHTSTRSILLHLGLTSNQLIELSNDGIIEYSKRVWKSTHRSKPSLISCVSLTPKGRVKKNAFIGSRRTSKPGLESDLSHDFQLQAYLAILHSKRQLRGLIGPAPIRDGALKDLNSGFPALPVTARDKPWNFDSVAHVKDVGGATKFIAFELERTPKKKLQDQQRFFEKLRSVGHSEYSVVILTESVRAEDAWRARLETWRTLGKPIEDGQHDDYYLLHDDGRTIAQSFEAHHLEQVITGKKKPSGKWVTQEPSAQAINRVADIQALSQAVKVSEAAFALKQHQDSLKAFIELARDPQEPRHLPPPSIVGRDIWPQGDLFLSTREILSLHGMDQGQLAELVLMVRARQDSIRAFRRQAEAPRPPPTPQTQATSTKKKWSLWGDKG